MMFNKSEEPLEKLQTLRFQILKNKVQGKNVFCFGQISEIHVSNYIFAKLSKIFLKFYD